MAMSEEISVTGVVMEGSQHRSFDSPLSFLKAEVLRSVYRSPVAAASEDLWK